MKRLTLLIVLFFIFPAVVVAQEPDSLPSDSIDVIDDDRVVNADSMNALVFFSSCDISTLIRDAHAQLGRMEARHHSRRASYYELHRRPDGTTQRKQGSDYIWREAPVRLINIKTCEIVDTEIVKRIQNQRATVSINDERFSVDVEERTYGKTWNAFNTPFVIEPPEWVVIGNKWKCVGTCLHNVGSVVYTPYSRSLYDAFPQLSREGEIHLRADYEEALADLRNKGVRSRAFPDSLVADISYAQELTQDYMIIAVSEHTDHQDFLAYQTGQTSYNPFKRMLYIVGANSNVAYAFTVSSAGARGMVQVMPSTCRSLRTLYPMAKLPVGCDNSPYDNPHGHIENIKAQILLYDYHLAFFLDVFGEDILNTPELHRYLAAAYNGGPQTVVNAVRKYGEKWDLPRCKRPRRGCVGLMTETSIYLNKFDYLIEHPEEIESASP